MECFRKTSLAIDLLDFWTLQNIFLLLVSDDSWTLYFLALSL